MAVVARITLFMNHEFAIEFSATAKGGGHRTLVNPSSIEFLSIAYGRDNNLSRPMDSLGENKPRARPCQPAIVPDSTMEGNNGRPMNKFERQNAT